MRDITQPGVLPLRPMTTGELLDAAIVLLRTRMGRLLAFGALLSLAEQAALFPLRRLADVDSSFLPSTEGFGLFGWVIVAGLALEALCVAVLGGLAATEAPAALLGRAAPVRPAARPGSVLVIGLVAAVIVGGCGWAFLVLLVPLQAAGLTLALLITVVIWPFGYGLIGLAAPAAVINQLGPMTAIGHGLALAVRTGLRAVWIRVLGYLIWLIIRIAMGFAVITIIAIFYDSPSSTIDNVVMGGTWLIVNALAYPLLGCLDVVLHLEVRMRTEGLDLALRRSLHRGVATDLALTAPPQRSTR